MPKCYTFRELGKAIGDHQDEAVARPGRGHWPEDVDRQVCKGLADREQRQGWRLSAKRQAVLRTRRALGDGREDVGYHRRPGNTYGTSYNTNGLCPGGRPQWHGAREGGFVHAETLA